MQSLKSVYITKNDELRFGRVRFQVAEFCTSEEEFVKLNNEKSTHAREVAEEILKRQKLNQNKILLPTKKR